MSKNIFTDIYEKGRWGHGSSQSPLSGPGSIPENAKPYVEFVKQIIDDYAISDVLDFGHGDWVMWRDYRFENVRYFGVDVVTGLSKKNQDNFGSEKRMFLQVDSDYLLPEGELLICKEVLQHLSQEDIEKFLCQISKFEFVLLCNAVYRYSILYRIKLFLQLRTRVKKLLNRESPFYRPFFLKNNTEIESGGFRGLDLESPNFSWAFEEFDLVQRFDFDTQHIKGIKQRVLLFRKSSK
jgi:hypothetical protein